MVYHVRFVVCFSEQTVIKNEPQERGRGVKRGEEERDRKEARGEDR